MRKDFLILRLESADAGSSRTVVVPKMFSLAFLHEAIQAAFGWLGCHGYQFEDAGGNLYGDGEDGDFTDPPDGRGKTVAASKAAIGKPLKKSGDTLAYMYDFGDGNEIRVTCLGAAREASADDFASSGPDLLEDSAAFGFTPGVVSLLSGRRRKSARAMECAAWLDSAFGRTPQSVLREPSAEEIAFRIGRLMALVRNALPARA